MKHITLIVHIDDVTLAARSKEKLMKIKEKLCDTLELADPDDVHWLLGIKVKYNHKE